MSIAATKVKEVLTIPPNLEEDEMKKKFSQNVMVYDNRVNLCDILHTAKVWNEVGWYSEVKPPPTVWCLIVQAHQWKKHRNLE